MSARSPRLVIPGEEELGVQRRCSRCGEFWPEDDEFFYPSTKGPGCFQSWCRACWASRNAEAYALRKTAVDREAQRAAWRASSKRMYWARKGAAA